MYLYSLYLLIVISYSSKYFKSTIPRNFIFFSSQHSISKSMILRKRYMYINSHPKQLFYPKQLFLKVLSSEMDPAEFRFIWQVFIKERGTEIFLNPSCESALKISRHLVQLLAVRILTANTAMKFMNSLRRRDRKKMWCIRRHHRAVALRSVHCPIANIVVRSLCHCLQRKTTFWVLKVHCATRKSLKIRP